MAGSSPWGQIDHVTKYERGVSFVSTPGHGGFRISAGYAQKHLSPAAIRRSIVQGNYYFYEEDCDWAIPVFELHHLWEEFHTNKEDLMKTLSNWNADYLIERGIDPLPEQYARYLEFRKMLESHSAYV